MKDSYSDQIEKLYINPELYICEFMNYKDDIYFWPKLVDKIKPNRMLEIGIGSGRLINILHDRVKEYDGIDFSRAIVEYCKKNFNYSNVNLYNQNLKSCGLDRKYDLIILPFNVINNFYTEEDLSAAFNHIRNLCDDNTIVVIDTINPKIEDLVEQEKFVITNNFEVNSGLVSVYENKRFDVVTSTCIYIKKYVMDGKVINESVLPNRIFFHPELLLLIEHYGFEIVNKYGDYNFETFSNQSRKQILIMRRK